MFPSFYLKKKTQKKTEPPNRPDRRFTGFFPVRPFFTGSPAARFSGLTGPVTPPVHGLTGSTGRSGPVLTTLHAGTKIPTHSPEQKGTSPHTTGQRSSLIKVRSPFVVVD
jgi:hypothetical protein